LIQLAQCRHPTLPSERQRAATPEPVIGPLRRIGFTEIFRRFAALGQCLFTGLTSTIAKAETAACGDRALPVCQEAARLQIERLAPNRTRQRFG